MSESDRPQHDFSNDLSANSAESHEANPTSDKTPDVYVHSSELIRQQQEKLQLEKQQRGSSDPWWKNILHRKKEHPSAAKSEPIVSHSDIDSQQPVTLHSETPVISFSEPDHESVNPDQPNTQPTEEPVITSISELHTDSHTVIAEENSSESDHEGDEMHKDLSDQEEGVTTSIEASESTSQPPTRQARSRRWTSLIPGSSFLKKAVTSTAIVGSLAAPVSHIANAQELTNSSNHSASSEHTISNTFSHDSGVTFSNDHDVVREDTNDQIRNEFSVGESHAVEQDSVATNHTEQSVMPIDSFQDTYEKTKDAERIWGKPLTGNMREAYKYKDGTFTVRPVKYHPKGRMEVNPDSKEYHPWMVTSGLLVKEMIEGRIQYGDEIFVDSKVSQVNIVGDPNAGNITYESIAKANNNDHQLLKDGEAVIKSVDLDGNVGADEKYAQYNVQSTNLVNETGHTIAGPLWEFMQKEGKNYNDNDFYFTGYPISEPYWTTAMVNGSEQDVLVQAFERRTLTFTPSHLSTAPEYAVEYGNAGDHYREWRYNPIETEQGEQVNVLEFLLPDDMTKSLDGSHNLSTVYNEETKTLYFVKAGGREINGKMISGSYEQYEITDNGVYLRSDHENGDDKYYTFSNGILLKLDMKVGETIESSDNVVNFYDNNGELETTMPFPIKATLLAHKDVYLGGDLGTQEVMIYKYDWGSNYEVFYFSKTHGWVMWELYDQENRLEHNAIFNKIVDSVTHPAPSSRE